MAQITHTGNGDVSNTNNLGYSFTFPSLSESAIKVSVNNIDKTVTSDYTIHNFAELGSSNAYILFTSTTARGTGTVRIFRQTDGSLLKHTFQAGSAIKASDLNRVNLQALYLAEEAREYVNNLSLSNGGSSIIISGSNIADDSITTTKILDLEVGTADLSSSAVTTPKIQDDAVSMAKLGSGALPSDITVSNANLVDNTVTPAKLSHTTVAAGSYTAADITVDENGRLTSASNGTIATSEIADNAITLAKIPTSVQTQLAVPIGTVLSFAGTTLPTNFLLCDGATIPNGSGTITQTVNSQTVNITADFSALYAVIGATLPSMTDNRFVLHSHQNIRSNFNEDWKSFTLRSQQVGTYTHEGYMGKSTTTYLPTVHKWTAGSSGNQWGYQLKWDTSDVRPKNTVLLPIIKF